MTDKIDLTGVLAAAIDSAMDRGRPFVVSAVDADGNPAVSFRGSTYVHSPDQLAIWVRKQDEGLAAYVAANPRLALLYYDPEQGPDPATSPRRLLIKGRARVDPSANDAVYAGIPEVERGRDKERRGVALVIDVDSVNGFGGSGPINQARP
ncbi:pyridoxamine 5'-phosphate oxidase family protein [Amycolatopsis acidicola]|uniref:Pyridoxamine 5'-phosphate oxidase family protein n=1 Tax=Amycolatopsis acidicola TaxID=2596893 RepID=A0A5N0V2U2_9PSEU|nr:pyridoxamine 5'-phosphate oxidase family protein [Amycolatopsis acidicola]KAA9159078.1 pyridoxamine 5'-phosphate oxidase family protein [Amycolatopsis acidicola]